MTLAHKQYYSNRKSSHDMSKEIIMILRFLWENMNSLVCNTLLSPIKHIDGQNKIIEIAT